MSSRWWGLHTAARLARSSVPPQLRGVRWWTWSPARRSQFPYRHDPSRSSTARTILGDNTVKRFPTATGTPSSSTSTGSMLALARSCSSSESAIGIPAISAGPCRARVPAPRAGARRGVSSDVSPLLTERRPAHRRRGARGCPTPDPWPASLCSVNCLDRRFERGAHHVGQLAVEVQHALVRRPPHPQAPRLVPLTANPPSTASTAFRAEPGQLDRRHVRRPPRPLRIAELVRQLRDRAQLLRAQRTRRAPRRRSRATTRSPARCRACPARSAPTHPPPRRSHRSDPARPAPATPRALSYATAAAHPPTSSSSPAQPIRRPAPQLVEVIGDVEHAVIKTRGYDTHRPEIDPPRCDSMAP